MNKYEALKKYFGYSSFRSGQEEIIDNILNGIDCLGVMPTGAGKSICFQIPAVMLKGITLVISPLISLMKDQVNSLTQNGIPAAFINTSLTDGQIRTVYKRMRSHNYKIIYVAPERLTVPSFVELCNDVEISLICVDEAHCVSQWGHDFRPSYLQIADFISSLNKRPTVCAFTATATLQVRNDIVNLLKLVEPFIKVLSFDRKNLYFEVIKTGNKMLSLHKYLDLYSGKSGIVYCASRKKVDEICEKLSDEGYNVTKYHAGLDKAQRKRNQELFIYDEKNVIIATNAFGMGIDKSNVSFVIHYNMPGDIESYYQEAGRAGRDGLPADCILLFSRSDIRTQQFFIDNPDDNELVSEIDKLKIRSLRMKKLSKMVEYCESELCLRHFILKYFGEDSAGRCENCSSCNGNIESIDVTVDCQKILSCIVRAGQKENAETIADILKGSLSDKVRANEYDKLTTFAIMQNSEGIKELIDFLKISGYINENTDGILSITEKTRDVLFNSKHIRKPLIKVKNAKKTETQIFEEVDEELYARLIKLRNVIAKKNSVPSFVIFTNATLRAMASMKPESASQMLDVPGVGEKKLSKYGSLFIAEINKDKP